METISSEIKNLFEIENFFDSLKILGKQKEKVIRDITDIKSDIDFQDSKMSSKSEIEDACKLVLHSIKRLQEHLSQSVLVVSLGLLFFFFFSYTETCSMSIT